MSSPRITVIVPVYNVAPYLRRCLDSLKNQTLKDIEIVIIDDGSTDESGKIAEGYCVDPRFRVIHTENNGLSAARNRGIDEAKSDWLMFIDSDDWAEEDFCRIPYETAMENRADLVVFQTWYSHQKRRKKIVTYGIVDAETAVKEGDSYAWDKLYERRLFDGIRYPEDKVYEDLAVTHKIVFAAQTIVMIPNALCHHTYRKNSISQCKSAKNKRDGFASALERTRDLISYGCDESVYTPTLISYALGFLARAYPSNDTLFPQAESVVDSIDEIPSELTWQKRTMLRIWKVDKGLFHIMSRMMGQKDLNSKS